jgi:WD40 repeat protein
VASVGSNKVNVAVDEYYDDGDWVLCVANNDVKNVTSCALSNGEIQLYDQSTMHLLQSYQRNSLVTEMTFQTYDANVLCASSNDGSITLYDIRQQQQSNNYHPATLEMKNMLRPDEEALSVSMGFDGNIAAVGSSKSKIHFFDVRHTKTILGSYTQAHTDEVTRVRFQPQSILSSSPPSLTGTSTTSILVSCSEDGLACVFDTSQPTEESALMNILSVQSPIREVGFFGPKHDAVYCLTGSEALQLYHKDDPICRTNFGVSFRQDLSNQLLVQQQQQQQQQQHKVSIVSPMEYLVDCYWDPIQQELFLLAGSGRGDAGLFHVGEQGTTPLYYLHGGHRGVIRSWTHCSNTNISSSSLSLSFLTVGEDARMCEWSRGGSGTPPVGSNTCANFTTSTASAQTGPQIILTNSKRKRTAVPGDQFNGGGKLGRPRSRLRSTPY